MAGHWSQMNPLIGLLKDERWSLAEGLINKTSPGHAIFTPDPHNESPLQFVLGRYDYTFQSPIHLKLANLILQKGSESQFSSCRKELISTFVSSYLTTWCNCSTYTRRRLVQGSAPFVIGFDGEINMPPEEAKRQLLQFACMLADKVGWNRDEIFVSSVFVDVLGNPGGDLDILKLVCPTGHHLNDTDEERRTPLMLLSIRCPSPQLHLLDYLWTLPVVPDVHARDSDNRTALWYAVWKGHSGLVCYLCEKGANGSFDGHVYSARSMLRRSRLEVNPLVAGVLSDSLYFPKTGIFDKGMVDGILRQTVSSAVDLGHFSDRDTLKHVQALLQVDTNFPHLGRRENQYRNSVVTLMFGSLSAGLQQLCVRAIVNGVFFRRTSKGGSTWSLLSVSEVDIPRPQDYRTSRDIIAWHKNKASCVTPELVGDKMRALGIPTTLKTFFELEMAKAQLCFHVNQYDGGHRGGWEWGRNVE